MGETRALEPDEWAFWDTYMRAQRLLGRELERSLQRDCGISKAEFSVLVTLWRAPGGALRVGELVESLDWEKSRLSHLLTRMEGRGLVERVGAGGSYRTRTGLTAAGRRAAQDAIRVHGGNIRRFFFDPLTGDQAAAIRAWSEQTVAQLEPAGPSSSDTP